MQTYFNCWLLTFSCCFWSGDPIVSEETWINPRRAAFFFFFWDCTVAARVITFLIAGNLTECVQVQLTWKLSRLFDTWREAQFSSPIHVVPSLKKKKRKEKKKKTVHSTNEDWSWKISPSLCWTFRNWLVLYFNFLSLIVTYSSQFTWQGHRKLQWAMSKDKPLLSNRVNSRYDVGIQSAHPPHAVVEFRKAVSLDRSCFYCIQERYRRFSPQQRPSSPYSLQTTYWYTAVERHQLLSRPVCLKPQHAWELG